MRVDSYFNMGRGTVACVVTDGPCPVAGSTVRRIADGQTWTLLGVERFCIHLGTPGKPGEPVGLVLGDASIAVGDELEMSEPQCVLKLDDDLKTEGERRSELAQRERAVLEGETAKAKPELESE